MDRIENTSFVVAGLLLNKPYIKHIVNPLLSNICHVVACLAVIAYHHVNILLSTFCCSNCKKGLKLLACDTTVENMGLMVTIL
jgi:hypothetical protein